MVKRFLESKLYIIIAIFFVIAGIGYIYLPTRVPEKLQQEATIYEYQYQRDFEDVREVFEENWYWLTTRTYSPEVAEKYMHFMLDTKSPNEWEERYAGKLIVKVLRDHKNFLGFVAYYVENFYEGRVLYLAVKSGFRGKRYGQRLLEYAIEQLFAKNLNRVWLVTRANNKRAQSLYSRAGMQEYSREEGFVYFEVKKGT